MKLVKALALLTLLAATFAGGYIVRASKRGTPAAPARHVLYYVDSMNPAYRSDKPGVALDGMALQAVYADEPTATTGTSGDATRASVPPGAIKISPERQQLIGVKFATVELAGDARSIRTVGKVTSDETRVAHVHTRIDGWIEKVFVDFTGDIVKQGEPMLTIYSPEMLASQQELLLAVRARDLMRSNPWHLPPSTVSRCFKRRNGAWSCGNSARTRFNRSSPPVSRSTASPCARRPVASSRNGTRFRIKRSRPRATCTRSPT